MLKKYSGESEIRKDMTYLSPDGAGADDDVSVSADI